jgi:molybdopterin converting factor small subunit
VELFATLRKYHPNKLEPGAFQLDVPVGITIAELLAILKIPAGQAKQAFVSNRQRKGDYVLQDGERIGIFPPIAGGS